MQDEIKGTGIIKESVCVGGGIIKAALRQKEYIG